MRAPDAAEDAAAEGSGVSICTLVLVKQANYFCTSKANELSACEPDERREETPAQQVGYIYERAAIYKRRSACEPDERREETPEQQVDNALVTLGQLPPPTQQHTSGSLHFVFQHPQRAWKS